MDDEIYVNVEKAKSFAFRPSTSLTGSGPSRSERGLCAAVVFLSLLSVFLLAALIGLGVLYHKGCAAEIFTIRANLTECLWVSENKLSSLTEERDLLRVNLTMTTEELKKLQSLSKQKKTCPAGWTKDDCVCYLLSNKSGSWDEGRDDCRGQGADLLVIDTLKEQEFLSKFISGSAWIGLTDRAEEGRWKWVDGTPLTKTFWETNQPDNGSGSPRNGEEDCVEIRGDDNKHWNDLKCERQLRWICEK